MDKSDEWLSIRSVWRVDDTPQTPHSFTRSSDRNHVLLISSNRLLNSLTLLASNYYEIELNLCTVLEKRERERVWCLIDYLIRHLSWNMTICVDKFLSSWKAALLQNFTLQSCCNQMNWNVCLCFSLRAMSYQINNDGFLFRVSSMAQVKVQFTISELGIKFLGSSTFPDKGAWNSKVRLRGYRWISVRLSIIFEIICTRNWRDENKSATRQLKKVWSEKKGYSRWSVEIFHHLMNGR